MREHTGRPDTATPSLIIDTARRQLYISPNLRKEIVRPELAEMEEILRDAKALQEQMAKLLEAILVVVASGQNLSGNKEDY